jgi:sarcosine oxidase/L-pipecolate oxidase
VEVSVRALVVGAGIFGLTSARALTTRGWSVVVVDPGPVPHPLAESTDLSKAVRADYGADEDYLALMRRALDGWRRWNAEGGQELFHENGVTYLTRCPMQPGGFEYESWIRLTRDGFPVERLDAAAIARRFPAWREGSYVDGYVNGQGGWAESGRVVARLAEGLDVRGGVPVRALRGDDRIDGVVLADGTVMEADVVVVAAGAWTGDLVPWIAPCLRAVGQPVFHLRPARPERFAEPGFLTYGADISRTGWYGFPLHPSGVVKIANHGPGTPMHPGDVAARVVTAAQESSLRAFLVDTFPDLVDAPIVHRRICVYGDTWDEHFWIAPDPERSGLVVAAGGSGHAFKFAPVLGDLIADAVEGRVVPKFRWRPEVRPERGEEEARAR